MREKLRNIVTKALKLERYPEDLVRKNDEGLIATMGIDSVMALEILIWVEDEFQITIEDRDLSPKLIDSLGALETYINGRLLASQGDQSNGSQSARAVTN